MLWFVCLNLFALASAFPFGYSSNYDIQLVEYEGIPHQRNSLCLPSPFLGKVCLPSAFQLFMPLRTLRAGSERCLTIPIMRSHVVKVCPPQESVSKVESSKEMIKEDETETESLPDNTNTEVNGGEVEPEHFVKNESSVETKESELEDKSTETKNKIIRVSQEVEREFLEKPSFEDIESNLVR